MTLCELLGSVGPITERLDTMDSIKRTPQVERFRQQLHRFGDLRAARRTTRAGANC
jgi:hypothetical protein